MVTIFKTQQPILPQIKDGSVTQFSFTNFNPNNWNYNFWKFTNLVQIHLKFLLNSSVRMCVYIYWSDRQAFINKVKHIKNNFCKTLKLSSSFFFLVGFWNSDDNYIVVTHNSILCFFAVLRRCQKWKKEKKKGTKCGV